MRLDKYLANIHVLTRKQSRKRIPRGGFFINGNEVLDSATDVQEGDILTFEGIAHEIRWNVTIRLRKLPGYVSSDLGEGQHPSYKELLTDFPYTPLVHVAGRLDVDTEGLLIITSDGQLNHQIISPKRKKEKEYIVTLAKPITKKECGRLRKGVILDDGYKTLPAQCTHIDDHTINLVIIEGKYHQVKRMLEAIGNTVTHLKRVRVGNRTLDGLQPGEWEYC